MKLFLTLTEILISISLAGLILLQAKGIGLGRTFGASTYHSKRGMEKLIFKATIVLAVVFVIMAVLNHLFI